MPTTTPGLALEARNLVKRYPQGRRKPPVTALDGLSFGVEEGTVFGLLGPNGAGKSTTVKILATLSAADSGDAFVAGFDVRGRAADVRRSIGFVAQKQVSDPMDTGLENLVLAGQLHGMGTRDARSRAGDLLDRFGLAAAARRQVKTYSGGMARKLDVAIGLMHHPAVLFLDEPTTGLDPEARTEMWAEIERMAADERTTVLLTTHYLEEADRLASRLAIVANGRVVTEGEPEELKAALRGDAIVLELLDAADVDGALTLIGRSPVFRDVVREGRTVRARTDEGGQALPLALAMLDAERLRVASATVARPSLDDVYLAHTGRSFSSAHSEGSATDQATPTIDGPTIDGPATAEERAA
ncbi:ATP-binding cassette domain-containing protein [Agromyces aureus]|uniref:ABC transporter n=1 Tax=Agromyces aureus TaxID=453304 RepID=A0A191WIF8_9MICO|nr:ATP-binding cassette domain-containing protein [Agromyces aureus]ANJ28002.1 ABC transporter [Agromyces aureus]